MDSSLFVLIGYGLLMIGGLLLIVAAVLFYTRWRKFSQWAVADGIVLRLEARAIRPGERILSYPVVEFETTEFRVVSFESNLGTAPSPYRVGQTVRVRYDPADPQHAVIDSLAARYLGPIAALGFAMIAALLGVMFVTLAM